MVYRTAKDEVFKIYTWHGARFAQRGIRAEARLNELPSFTARQFSADGYSMPWYDDSAGMRSTKVFLGAFARMAAEQANFLARGYLYWDFGAEHLNYQLQADGSVCLLDYGGAALIALEASANRTSGCFKPPLLRADERFIRLAVLAHLARFALGEKTALEWLSLGQFGSRGTEKGLEWCGRRFAGTSFEPLSRFLSSQDFGAWRADSWLRLASLLEALANTELPALVQESADITSVVFGKGLVSVRGYQDYDLSSGDIRFRKSRKMHWETARKAEIVIQAMELLGKSRTEVQSAVDIGSNLGAYVFLLRLKFSVPAVTGVDYNPEYVRRCSEIAERAEVDGAEFRQGTFGTLEESFDLVLALGLVHHLYHRTEEFNDLKLILQRLSRLARRTAIVEFPTEHDPKAAKWTATNAGAKTGYTEAAFLDAAHASFSDVRLVGETAPNRRIYLLSH